MDSARNIRVRQIVSGGQTGVDRGALDAAIALGIEHGGWCPRGRRAEDGVIPARYQQNEMESFHYHLRTEQNVIDSDATLIVARGPLSGGTELTRRMALKHNRPHQVVDLAAEVDLDAIRNWLVEQRVVRLNIAGPRESSSRGIARAAQRFVEQLLASADEQFRTPS